MTDDDPVDPDESEDADGPRDPDDPVDADESEDGDGPVDPARVTDVESFRQGLTDLLVAADAAGVEAGTMVGLLTANLAALRGEVRLPLSVPPERAHEFLAIAQDREGETMEVELELTEAVAEDVALQLSAIRSGEGVEDGAEEE